jgi:hypothetical protein
MDEWSYVWVDIYLRDYFCLKAEDLSFAGLAKCCNIQDINFGSYPWEPIRYQTMNINLSWLICSHIDEYLIIFMSN